MFVLIDKLEHMFTFCIRYDNWTEGGYVVICLLEGAFTIDMLLLGHLIFLFCVCCIFCWYEYGRRCLFCCCWGVVSLYLIRRDQHTRRQILISAKMTTLHTATFKEHHRALPLIITEILSYCSSFIPLFTLNLTHI